MGRGDLPLHRRAERPQRPDLLSCRWCRRRLQRLKGLHDPSMADGHRGVHLRVRGTYCRRCLLGSGRPLHLQRVLGQDHQAMGHRYRPLHALLPPALPACPLPRRAPSVALRRDRRRSHPQLPDGYRGGAGASVLVPRDSRQLALRVRRSSLLLLQRLHSSAVEDRTQRPGQRSEAGGRQCRLQEPHRQNHRFFFPRESNDGLEPHLAAQGRITVPDSDRDRRPSSFHGERMAVETGLTVPSMEQALLHTHQRHSALPCRRAHAEAAGPSGDERRHLGG
mmetsp:Transcript_51928/g.161538  ORF Transcript_51928/g.161538 Transcript_51928/m.161538 type:complete len:279 (+) Transcript_51928:1504-2340(+)